MKPGLKIPAAGFSLLELLIVLLVSSVLMGAAVTLFVTFVNTSAEQSIQDTISSEVSLVSKILEKELMLAGYGLPLSTRVASDNNCNVSDETFCVNGTDRLFIADGTQLLKDITDNNEDDGKIGDTEMTNIANAKNSAVGGYCTYLLADAVTGATSLSLQNLNVNLGQERAANPTTNDFIENNALILGDNSQVEGHRIAAIGAAVSLMPLDSIVATLGYLSAAVPSPVVVPASAWYVRNDPDGRKYPDGTVVRWLYKNNYKVLPNVDNFQVQYGYDANNDGIQWADTVPPPVIASPNGIPDDVTPFIFSYLKIIRITMTIKIVYKTKVKTTLYTKEILLKN